MSLVEPQRPSARDMKQHAREEFQAWAGTYDRSLLNYFLFRPSYIFAMEEIARWHHEHQRPVRVLDIGCATGTLARTLAESPLPATIVGLDFCPKMCGVATAKAKHFGIDHKARFVNADSEFLPFDDGSFDMVTCSNSFHHYPKQDAAVAEMHRVLDRDGRVMIIDGFRDCVIGWFVFDVVISRIEHGVYHAPWPVMNGYFEKAGLSNIRRRQFNFWFPSLATIGDRVC